MSTGPFRLAVRDGGHRVHAVPGAPGTWSTPVAEAASARRGQAGAVPVTGVAVGAARLDHRQSATGAAHARLIGDQLPFAGNGDGRPPRGQLFRS